MLCEKIKNVDNFFFLCSILAFSYFKIVIVEITISSENNNILLSIVIIIVYIKILLSNVY